MGFAGLAEWRRRQAEEEERRAKEKSDAEKRAAEARSEWRRSYDTGTVTEPETGPRPAPRATPAIPMPLVSPPVTPRARNIIQATTQISNPYSVNTGVPDIGASAILGGETVRSPIAPVRVNPRDEVMVYNRSYDPVSPVVYRPQDMPSAAVLTQEDPERSLVGNRPVSRSDGPPMAFAPSATATPSFLANLGLDIGRNWDAGEFIDTAKQGAGMLGRHILDSATQTYDILNDPGAYLGQTEEEFRENPTATGAVWRRYLQRSAIPATGAQQVLQENVPGFEMLGDTLNALGAVTEAGLATDINAIQDQVNRTYANLGLIEPQPDLPYDSVGMQWGRLATAFDIIQEMDDAEARQTGQTGVGQMQLNMMEAAQDPGTYIKQRWNMAVNALAMANNQWAAGVELTPEQEEAARKDPRIVPVALAEAWSMGHHGMVEAAKQFDDIVELPAKREAARSFAVDLYQQALAMPAGPEQDKLLWDVSQASAEALRLENTHSLQLFDENANWWHALPAEFLLDPLSIVEGGLKLFRLTPMLRRIDQGRRLRNITPDQAIVAIRSGKGIDTSWTGWLKDFMQVDQTKKSKSMVDVRDNWRSLTNILHGFDAKEDIVKIFKTLGTDATALALGIPLTEFKSTNAWLRAADGLVVFPPAALADKPAVRAQQALAPVVDLIESLPSLQGTGVANLGAVGAELRQLLATGSATFRNVSVLSQPFPPQAKRAVANISAGGTAVVEYFGQGNQLLKRSVPMAVAEAQELVAEFGKVAKSGDIYKQNYLRTAGEVLRNAMGALSLNNPLNIAAIPTNMVSDRVMAIMDGNYAVDNLQKRARWAVGLFDGFSPTEGIGAYLADPAIEMMGSLANREMGGKSRWEIPGMDFVRQARHWGERNVKANVETKVLRDEMYQGVMHALFPDIEDSLRGVGIADERTVEVFANAIATEGLERGPQAMRKMFNDIVMGRQKLTLNSINPNAGDYIPDDIAQGIDALMASVRPENIQAVQQQLHAIGKDLLSRMDVEISRYGPNLPDRGWWTRHEMQQDIATMTEHLKSINQFSGGKLGINVDAEVKRFADMQKGITEAFGNLFNMGAIDAGMTPYIYGTWEEIDFLRRQALAANEAMVVAIKNAPFADRGKLWDRYGIVSDRRYKKFERQARELIDDTYNFLQVGGWQAEGAVTAKGIGDIMNVRPLLEAMAIDETEVFELGRQLGKTTGLAADALRDATREAGRKGLDKFMAVMNIALQKHPSDSGFDHYMSAIDNVSDYYRSVVIPAEIQIDRLWEPIRQAEAAAKAAAIAAGKTVAEIDQAIFNAASMADRGAAAKQTHALRNAAYADYYAYAYSRYQAAAMFIVQPGMVNLQFNPLNGFAAQLSGGQPVTFAGFDLGDPRNIFVQFSSGKKMPMPIKYVPPDIIAEAKKFNEIGHKKLADAVGALGVRLFDEGTGIDEIDKLIASVRNGGYEDIYNQVRLNVADFVKNNRTAPMMSGTVEREFRKQAGNIISELIGAVPEMATWNAKAPTMGNIDALTNFNKNVMGKYENIRYGAVRAAEEASSFSIIDFINEYNTADVALGLYAPYLFWSTRQGKNIIERTLFAPTAFSRGQSITRAMESDARAEGRPLSQAHTIGTGIQMDGGEVRLPVVLGKWWPSDIRHVMNGWANPQRANQGLDYILDGEEQEGFGKFNSGLLGMAMYGKEMLGAVGISGYPWWEAGLDVWAGRGNQVSWGDFSVPTRLLGHVNQWNTGRVDNEFLGVGLQSYTAPHHAGVNIRDAAAEYSRNQSPDNPLYAGAVNHNTDVGTYAKALRIVIQSQAQGYELDSRFLERFPGIQEEAQAWISKAGRRATLSMIIGQITGVPPKIANEGETIYREDAQNRRDALYDPAASPQGARAANQVYESDSPNYNPGLAANTVDPMPDEPGDLYPSSRGDLDIIYSDYLNRRDAMGATVAEEQEAFLAQHGGAEAVANDYDLSKAYREIGGDLFDQYEALDEQWPDMAERRSSYEFDASKLNGANPIEIRNAALEQLYFQAKEEVAELAPPTWDDNASRSEKKTWGDQNDRYKAAWKERFNELKGDPRAASAAVFGLPIPTQDGGYMVDPALQQQAGVEEGPILPLDGPLMTPEGEPVDAGSVPEFAPLPVEPVVPEGNAPPLTIDNTPVVLPAERAALANPAPQADPLPPTAQATEPTTYPASPKNKWGDVMMEAERKYGLPMGILDGLAENESNFVTDAVGGNGVGLFQFEPAAWADAKAAGAIPQDAVRTDPEASALAAAWYLDWINTNLPADKQDDMRWVIAAYNQGLTRVTPMDSMADVAAVQAATIPYIERILAKTQEKQAEMAPSVTNDLANPVEGMRMTQKFGNPGSTYTAAGFAGHEGVDFGAYEGAPIYSAAGGTVVSAGNMAGTANAPYGNLVVVDHGNGYKTYYAHLSGVNVEVGDVVEAGHNVGAMGNTGNSRGTHLHFGLQNTNNRNNGYRGFIDPMPYLNGDKAWPGGGGLMRPVDEREAELAEEHNHVEEKVVAHQPDTTLPVAGDSPDAPLLDMGVGTEDFFDEKQGEYDSPAQKEFEAETAEMFAEKDARIQQAYPEYAYLQDQWEGTDDEDRPRFKEQNPEITAVNLAYNNPEEHAYITETWGPDAALRYARTPASEAAGGEPGVRNAYYRDDPDAFLIRSWLNGRPEAYDESEEGKTTWEGYDAGTDYEEAKAKFGDEIWDIVRLYYQLPASDPGNKEVGKIRGEFYDAYPQYQEWADWWWASFRDGEDGAYTASGSGRGSYSGSGGYARGGSYSRSGYYGGSSYSRSSYGGYSGGSSQEYWPSSDHPTLYNPSYETITPAEYRAPAGTGDGSGWRRWLSLSETELRSWRR